MGRLITTWFIIIAPMVILLFDLCMLLRFGPNSTITWVIRGWSKDRKAPEVIYVVGAVLLYLHLFRGWL